MHQISMVWFSIQLLKLSPLYWLKGPTHAFLIDLKNSAPFSYLFQKNCTII